ncbi:MAG: Vitamin B12 dependent methionine synthase activation subunit [Ruminococcaceae bacterium]|nr:Vitamin B12 dependent methionine synthase activation subunit [Oscillospiraceae bacterium]
MIALFCPDAPPIDRREILRYAGVRTSDPATEALLDECLAIAQPVLTYRACHGTFPVRMDGDRMDFSFASVKSASLAKFLTGCTSVMLLAATVGIGLDRLIARTTVTSPARALLLDAIGVERVEALCDSFSPLPRFSPGYGDLPLDFQREIFRALDCQRKIGLSLNESLLMSPSKSVTAIIGIKENL